ncbi:MAG: hypothetical protein HC915_10975 [Anaerolineae bacterium]|nr:hypothetical protein [Anaerolineae bacterium]
MKIKFVALLVTLLALAGFAAPLSAQDPAPGTVQDNLCYPGGLLAGTCDTALEWRAGWWGARIIYGDADITQTPPEIETFLLRSGVADEFQIDNLCSLEGQSCMTDYDWQAGYWLARLRDGRITVGQLPAQFRGLVATPQCSVPFSSQNVNFGPGLPTFNTSTEICFYTGEVVVTYTTTYTNGAGIFPTGSTQTTVRRAPGEVRTSSPAGCPAGQYVQFVDPTLTGYVCLPAS